MKFAIKREAKQLRDIYLYGYAMLCKCNGHRLINNILNQ